jgi:hypothetical protein
MLRTAIFVDAGYLFAQGSVLLAGEKQGREFMALDIPPLVDALREVVVKEAHLPLLRVYWYDAMRLGRPSPEQMALADFRDVKLRLGQVNAAGEQKGVDALIVTDLVELARNQAISDAVLMSGDEDVRVGVLLCQQFGVRVHLVGIHPARSNQSRSLMQEADTSTVWDESTVRTFLSCIPYVAASEAATAASGSVLEAQMMPLVAALSLDERTIVKEQFAKGLGIPPEHDKALLKIGRAHFAEQTLNPGEKALLREMFVRLVTNA